MLFPHDEYAELCGCKLISFSIAENTFRINFACMKIFKLKDYEKNCFCMFAIFCLRISIREEINFVLKSRLRHSVNEI